MLRIIFVLLSLFIFGITKATHTNGLNISYEHISGDSFRINCEAPVSCAGTFFNNGNCVFGGPMASAAYFSIYCPTQGFLANDTAYLDTFQFLPLVCDSGGYNSCVFGPCALAGMARRNFSAIVDLGELDTSSCNEWMFVWSVGARPAGANYINQPNIVSWSTINVADFPTNSSVQIRTLEPAPFYCDGKQVTYNWGAIDPDGDSLHWELDTAMQSFSNGSFTSVIYASGYSPSAPMPGSVALDAETGQLSFTATKPLGYSYANYAVAVLIKEYDRTSGVLKGTLHRDVHFYVVDSCENEAPAQVGAITSTAALLDSVTVIVCDGEGVQLKMVYADYDSSGALTIDSLNIHCDIEDYVDGAYYSHTGGNPDTLTVDIPNIYWSNFTKQFNVHVSDNHCPFVGFNTYTYALASNEPTYLDPDTTICSDDTIMLNAHGGDTFLWQVLYGDPILVGTNFGCVGCQQPWVKLSQNTGYLVTSNLSPVCGNTDTIYIDVFDEYAIEMEPAHGGTVAQLVYCASDPVDTLLANFSGGVFQGSGITNSNLGLFDPASLAVAQGLDTVVDVVYEWNGACANSDTLNLRVKGLPNVEITSNDSFAENIASVQLTASFAAGAWSSSILGNPTAGGTFYPNQFVAPDSIRVFHFGNDSGCVNTDSMLIHVVPADTSLSISESQPMFIHLFPNPASHHVNVTTAKDIQYVRIRNVQGLMIGSMQPKSSNFQIDLGAYASGTYFLDLYTADRKEFIRTVIVQ